MPFLVALSICCFCAALIIRMVDPVIPDIARSYAASPADMAMLASAFAFPYALGQPILGPLGDAIGKSRIIQGCLIVLFCGLVASALAPTPEALFGARIVSGLAAGGTVPVSLAMVGDRVPVAERQIALSRLLVAMLTGQLLGAVGAGVVGSVLGWRAVMWIGAGLIGISIAIATLYLAPRQQVERKPFSLSTIIDGYKLVFQNPRAKICYGAVFVGGLCLFGLFPHIAALLEARNAGSIKEAGFVIAGAAIGGVIYAIFVRKILAVLGGQLNMIRAGGIIAAVGLAICAMHLSWQEEMAAFGVLGIGFYMIHNSLQTQVTELAPSARGAAVSLHAFCFFMGQASGPPVYASGFNSLGTIATIGIASVTMAVLGLALAHLLQTSQPVPVASNPTPRK